jgi:hypothetical protein
MTDNISRIDVGEMPDDSREALTHASAALIAMFNAMTLSGVPLAVVANAAMKSTARFLHYVSSDGYSVDVPDEELATIAKFFHEELELQREMVGTARPAGHRIQ